jgi:hypothetical protein
VRACLFVIILFNLMAFGLAALAGAAAREPATTISGGGLPFAVQLTPVDEAAFRQRLNLPPLLDEEPELRGTSYDVTSTYWDAAVRDADDGESPVEINASYYPEGGFVRTRQAGTDVWLVIDLRQRAILDRYIALGQESAIGATPAVLDVLRAAAAGGEQLAIQIGDVHLSEVQRDAFWRVAAAMRAGERATGCAAQKGGESSTWLVFTLPEGRSIEMVYTPEAGTLVDSLGCESYIVPGGWLVPVLGTEAPAFGDTHQRQVAQEKGAGSPLWWPLMLGLGFSVLGGAVWLARRSR